MFIITLPFYFSENADRLIFDQLTLGKKRKTNRKQNTRENC